jgi:hypothetical protein
MTAQTVPLEYAPSVPIWWRRRLRRALAFIALLALVAAAIRWGPQICSHAKLLYWQRQCLRYEPPAAAVLFEADPTRAAALKRQSVDYVATPNPIGAAYFHPLCLRQLESTRSITPVVQMTIGSTMVFGPVTLFVHELKSPLGKRRLVVVEGATHGNLYGLAHDLGCRVYEPAGICSALKLKSIQFAGPWGGPYDPAPLGIGHPDPKDPSHFTLPYSYGKDSGTLDAYLSDDELIHFTRRDGPGKGPPTAGPGGFRLY